MLMVASESYGKLQLFQTTHGVVCVSMRGYSATWDSSADAVLVRVPPLCHSTEELEIADSRSAELGALYAMALCMLHTRCSMLVNSPYTLTKCR